MSDTSFQNEKKEKTKDREKNRKGEREKREIHLRSSCRGGTPTLAAFHAHAHAMPNPADGGKRTGRSGNGKGYINTRKER